ncbi:MAG: FAD-binding protein [Anaerolineae bacterium]|nr:FAD-binding protein [Anaerolineae bacterium]
MVCFSPSFHEQFEQEFNKRWPNWNGSVEYSAERYFRPATLSDLVIVARNAALGFKKLHAIGSAWAFEDLASSEDWVISLSKLKYRLLNVVDDGSLALTDEWQRRQDNTASPRRLYHVQAGIEIGELSEQLQRIGLAMPTLGGKNGQSLAGAISTSTHGGEWERPPLPDLVRAIHLVTYGGRELWIERASEPITSDDTALLAALPCPSTEIVRSDEIFNAVLVSFGRFGIIYAFVLEVRQSFSVVEVIHKVDRAAVLNILRLSVKASKPFAPLFQLLSTERLPSTLTEAMTDGIMSKSDPTFLQLVFNSLNGEDLWVQRRWETTAGTPDLNVEDAEPFPCSYAGKNAFLQGAIAIIGGAAGQIAAAIPLYGIYVAARVAVDAARFADMSQDPNVTGGQAMAAVLQTVWDIPPLGSTAPAINRLAIELEFRASQSDGRRGPHHLITSGSRARSHSDCYRADSIEVIFSATSTAYLDFLDGLLHGAPGFKQLGYISLRYTRPSRAELSMHNISTTYVVSIEVATLKGLPDNAVYMRFVETLALHYGGRPHWGQINKLNEAQVLRLYGDRVNRWRDALLRVVGAETTFSNTFTRQRGLEPVGISRQIVGVRRATNGSITHICGPAGSNWSPITVADAIQHILTGAVIYSVRIAGQNVPIRVNNDFFSGLPSLVVDTLGTGLNALDQLPRCWIGALYIAGWVGEVLDVYEPDATVEGIPSTRELFLHNSSNQTITVRRVTVSTDATTNAIFNLRSPVPFDIAPGQNYRTELTVTSLAAGMVHGTVEVASNDTIEPVFSVPLSTRVYPLGRRGALRFMPNSLTFDNLPLKSTMHRILEIIHSGETYELTYSLSLINEQPAGQFSLPSTIHYHLSPGERDSVAIGYNPEARGAATATLAVDMLTKADGTQQLRQQYFIPLTGFATRPTLFLSSKPLIPADILTVPPDIVITVPGERIPNLGGMLELTSLDFGFVQVNTTVRRSFWARSVGDVPLTLLGVICYGQGAFRLVYPQYLPTILQPGEEIEVSIEFYYSLTSANFSNTPLHVITDDPVRPSALVIANARTAGAHLSGMPDIINFGQIDGPTDFTFKLHSDGSSPVEVFSAKIVSGPNFIVSTSLPLPVTLSPGDMLEVTVTAQVSSQGKYHDRITINHDAPNKNDTRMVQIEAEVI